MKKILLAMVILMGCVFWQGCGETREESIIREQGYLADHPVEEVAHYWRDVPYAEADGMTLTLDVCAPESASPLPVLMIIHGGGWEMHTNGVMEGMARYISNRGYVVFNVNYRVLSQAPMDKIVEDVFGALIWIKEHAAEYNGDASRIAVTGDSAGGHLTAMVVTQGGNPALTPTYRGNGKTDLAITCAIPTYGVFDFVALNKVLPSYAGQAMGVKYKDDPARYEMFSPIRHLRAGLPPQLVIVGNMDPLYHENKRYVKAVNEAGSQAELWVYPGQTHAFLNNFWGENGQKGYNRMVEFLDKELK